MNPYQIERFNNRQLDMRITFMDDESEKIIFVDDWRELGYYYRRYKGENIIRCAKCGKLERGNKKPELRNIANNALEIYRHMNMIISNANVLTAGKCLMF